MSAFAAHRAVNIEDLRKIAKKRLPRAVFDYLDGAADSEVTLRENCREFDNLTFRPRGAVFAPDCDLTTTVCGQQLQLPFLLAPLGSSRLFYPRGEMLAAREAGVAGTAYILSTFSGCGVEDVRVSSSGPVWYQVYLAGGRDVAAAGIRRAHVAGCAALVLTIDTPVAGMRERDVRNGIRELAAGRIFDMLPFLSQFITRPGWLAGFLADGGLMKFPNVVLPGKGPMHYADVGAALAQAVVTWNDLRWIREIWDRPIVIKGLLTADDARIAADHGVQAVVVSNHGGRQLDTVSPTLRALPEIVEAVGNRVEVLLDGGIRRGSDVVKALCLGARAVLVGRAYGYGLAATGGPGVARAIEILRSDIVRTLKLLGAGSLTELRDPAYRYLDLSH